VALTSGKNGVAASTGTSIAPTAVTQASVRPKLAIALGDPAGIGPEVILKALADPQLRQSYDITLVGSYSGLRHTYQHLQAINQANQANPSDASTPTAMALPALDDLTILDIPLAADLKQQIQLGRESAASGAASFHYLETAIAHTLAGEFQAIVTAPIAKSAWKAAGHPYPGQTELLAEKAGVKRFGMLFVARSPHTNWTLRTLLATTHIPLQQVPTALNPDVLTLKLELLVQCLQQDFGIAHPRIAIAGLNPHSGEQGQLGQEEIEWLIPWLHRMRQQLPSVQLDGPIPPDTLWVRPGQAWYGGATVEPHDGYLALYHDQGLIPVKLMAFDRAVNTTIGLPFVRTSPDHGTAFDIAGKGIADATSMKAAIHLAGELVERRAVGKGFQPGRVITTQGQLLR
jgi:4-hydroxythreonine-4-phosphate dehydrogenase